MQDSHGRRASARHCQPAEAPVHHPERPAGRHFDAVLDARYDRRTLLRGSVAAAVTALFTPIPALATRGARAASGHSARLGFDAVPVSEADTVRVPAGYRWQVLAPWGEPICGRYPPFDLLNNSGVDQGEQMGMHHDGMHYFPIEGRHPWQGSSRDGLLVVNHEYVEPRLMHSAAVGRTMGPWESLIRDDGTRDSDEVLKEINAHGVSIVRIQRDHRGQWNTVRDPRNRRITPLTPMSIAGPVRGSPLVRTRYSPDGTRCRGTVHNCAHGVTPWNTYLTCEENWALTFSKPGAQPREQARYNVPAAAERTFGWSLADRAIDEFRRFDASPTGVDAREDYRNEPNTFGWIVEIDPFDPQSTPVKRTALGRFAHEGMIFAQVREGRPVVCYSGDDASNEYIYKFVSDAPYHRESAGGHLLDEGTLYVARFDEDGTGRWLPLRHGVHGLEPSGDAAPNTDLPGRRGFIDQADVLVNARSAADRVGATPMDRPEWGAVDPASGLVYFTLTNNNARDQADAANPRIGNRWGHIVRWRENGDDPAATGFHWDLFVLAGPPDDSEYRGEPLDESQVFANPDGLWFDADGRLWIQTDISERVMNAGDFRQFGNNQMLAADPVSGDLRRFLTGPIGQEITGCVSTPDQTTLFVNVQHPGATTTPEEFAAGRLNSDWPDGNGRYPRSATLAITRDDGGAIGR